ncbi:hypothetical protein [Spirochaeta cellobiosiphila]|uniref:hypothetical protein n=1 Tax=Spirochaeta cellobiosiphila TaxID=504483 RepID=UPI00041E6D19|nr:hypothetical protein [Spirochaeta cellobiosiphila]
MTYQEKERLSISIIAALILHLLIWFVMTFFDWHYEPTKEVLGPLYVDISPLPGSAVKTVPNIEVKEDSTREKPKAEETNQDIESPSTSTPSPNPQNDKPTQIAQGLATDQAQKTEVSEGEVVPNNDNPSTVVQGEKNEPQQETQTDVDVTSKTSEPVQEAEEPSPWFQDFNLDDSLKVSENSKGTVQDNGSGESSPTENVSGIEWDDPTKGRELIYGPPIKLPSGFNEQISFEIEFEITEAGNLVPLKVIPKIVYGDVRKDIFDQLRKWRFKPAPSQNGKDNVVRGRIPIDTVIKR